MVRLISGCGFPLTSTGNGSRNQKQRPRMVRGEGGIFHSDYLCHETILGTYLKHSAPQFTLYLQGPKMAEATTLSPCKTSGKQALAGLPGGSSGGFSGAPPRHPIPILRAATQFGSEATDLLAAHSCRAACIALPVVMCHELDPKFSLWYADSVAALEAGKKAPQNRAEDGRGHYRTSSTLSPG